jgi:uncharacterized lipoprotein YddW (UPF0748 family)
MKRLLAFAILVFVCSISASAQVKGVWVRPFIKADIATRKDPVKGREYIRQDLERVKAAGLNTVYLEVFWDSYTLYPSKFVPQRPLSIAYGVASKDAAGQTETWDPLLVYIAEGEKLGISIHAWLHVFHQWSTHLGPVNTSPIFKQYPEWAALDQNGSPNVVTEAEGGSFKVFLSPSNPMVRKFLRQVVGELADKYPKLGGIQWDYIRYPLQYSESPFDYNPLTLEAFKKETGLDAKALSPKGTPKEWRVWKDWKTRQVTEVVRDLGELVRKLRPTWEISAAVFPSIEQNLREKQQDWKTWSEKGYIDVLMPMLYSTNFGRVESWAKEFKADVSPKTRIYPAFFIGHFYKAQSKEFNPAYLDLEKKLGFNGFGVFASQSLTDDLIQTLADRK